jgi:hypothetical protein
MSITAKSVELQHHFVLEETSTFVGNICSSPQIHVHVCVRASVCVLVLKMIMNKPTLFIMHFLHDVHEMNACRSAMSVCPCIRMSVLMIQLQNHWTDLDEIWYGLYIIGVYPKIVVLNFLQSNTYMTDE